MDKIQLQVYSKQIILQPAHNHTSLTANFQVTLELVSLTLFIFVSILVPLLCIFSQHDSIYFTSSICILKPFHLPNFCIYCYTILDPVSVSLHSTCRIYLIHVLPTMPNHCNDWFQILSLSCACFSSLFQIESKRSSDNAHFSPI